MCALQLFGITRTANAEIVWLPGLDDDNPTQSLTQFGFSLDTLSSHAANADGKTNIIGETRIASPHKSILLRREDRD